MISRLLVSCAVCTAGAGGARIVRKTAALDVVASDQAKDCYSKYDGKVLMDLTPCTSADVVAISLQLEQVACQLVDEKLELPAQGCASAEAVCSEAVAETLEKLSGVRMVSTDAGGYWRNSSGVVQPYWEGQRSSFYTAWRDLDARMAKVESLVRASDGIATIETVGQTLQGRDMKIVRFTGARYRSGDPKVFLTFNLHAREWIGGMSGVYAVEKLIARVKQEPTYLAGMEVVMMPMANPDGFVQSSTSDRMHRKNMREVSSRCFGVDVNRNYDAHWASGGSSNDPCSDTYHGPAAMSEPETKVIARVMKESPMTVYVDVHAYSQLILEAYGWTRQNHPRQAEYSTLGGAIKTAIRSTHGVTFTEGPIAQVLYAASGSTVDYADDLGALGLCFELSPGRYGGGGFAPPTSDIIPGAEECFAGILATIDYAVDPPAPTPEPIAGCNPSFSNGPDFNNDCTCKRGLDCYQDGSRRCQYSRKGWWSVSKFSHTCGGACVCK